MTETQTPNPDHRAPLKPGEIRIHTVGTRTFQVMHVAGGSFTQASVREPGPIGTIGRVLATERFEDAAVRAYANAIEQAESDAIDALDDADGSMFISSSTGELVDPQAGPAQFAVVTRSSDRTEVLDIEGPMPLDEAVALADRAHAAGSIARVDVEPVDLSFNLPMGANMRLVTGESRCSACGFPADPKRHPGCGEPTTVPSLADDVAALRTQYGTLCAEVAVQRDDRLAVEPFDRVQAIRREILDRIAAQVPVRATDAHGAVYRMHMPCRRVMIESRSACWYCDEVGEWRALYTLGGA